MLNMVETAETGQIVGLSTAVVGCSAHARKTTAVATLSAAFGDTITSRRFAFENTCTYSHVLILESLRKKPR